MLHLGIIIVASLLLLPLWPHPAHGASPESFKTPEFYNGGGLDIINAAEAYALGYTGQGITLGIVDQPIRTEHPELAGKAWAVAFVLPSGELHIPNWEKEPMRWPCKVFP